MLYGVGIKGMAPMLKLKARLLCEGVNPDETAEKLFLAQNPSGAKRGGLSSGGKFRIFKYLPVNAPFYREREVALKIVADPNRARGLLILEDEEVLCEGEALPAPEWYGQKVGDFDITQILTAHNLQLAGSVYEDCALFGIGEECKFCVINRSLGNKAPALVKKTPDLILRALGKIPVQEYGGLTLNGGMTLSLARGMELIEPVVRAVRQEYPNLPIAVEITPPKDLDWIDRMADAGVSSLMMNLETWDEDIRAELIPGKSKYCPRDQYLEAFSRGLNCLGGGMVSTCFVVGTEPIDSLKKGIQAVIKRGIVPSPLAGRYFEDVPGYPFSASTNPEDFIEILRFAKGQMKKAGLQSGDKAGCVACQMCDCIAQADVLLD